MKRRRAALGVLVGGLALLAAAPGRAEPLEADAIWPRRAAAIEGRLAAPEATERALAVFLEAAERGDPTARWKALRAAHYLSEFTSAPEARRDEVIEQAVSWAKAATEAFERSSDAGPPHELDDEALAAWLERRGLVRADVARGYFWSAIVWGARGQRVGLLTIVREGVARKMFDYTRVAVRLDPEVDRGGGYRLLSRLHAELPRVPFVTRWVDRDQTLPLAEQAADVAPEDPGNRLVLARALLERAPSRRAEARALLEAVAALEPREVLRAEDLAIREQARETLASLRED